MNWAAGSDGVGRYPAGPKTNPKPPWYINPPCEASDATAFGCKLGGVPQIQTVSISR